ncbi:MAG: NADH-quinone oxidoreductase subunit D [Candidatus Sericytochromatia bacterium]|nr:NADH-quinone oxidoreductase subunit D [Candidatus Sericytochromatia bacterium]
MIEFKTEEMTINMGPNHPSTHGVLRLILKLDGEIVKDCEPVIGYLHRSIERSGQDLTYYQFIPVLDRFDYLSNIFSEYVYVLAVEKVAGIECPVRADFIRVLTMEINRITSHLFWLGTFVLDLGATSIIMYTMRERELLFDLLEELTGQRMMYNYIRIGGVNHDLPPGWTDRLRDFLKNFRNRIDEYESIVTDNPIFRARVENIGVLKLDRLMSYGVTGPTLRASGMAYDLRRDEPYSVYDQLDFDIPTGKNGDSLDRYRVRLQEMRESAKILEQALAMIPEGHVKARKIPALYKAPPGEAYVQIEAPRGNMGCYYISDGSTRPARVKLRGASFHNLAILPEAIKGSPISDIMAIFGSMDVIIPEVDR